MKRNIILFIVSYLIISSVYSQTIHDSLLTDWTNPGYKTAIPNPNIIVNILDFGGSNDSSSDNVTALNNAISSLAGQMGIICFPAGKYLFTQSISLPSNVIIKGKSSDSTHFYFNLNGNGNAFNIIGSSSINSSLLTGTYLKGQQNITVTDGSIFSVGDYIAIKQDGNTLMTSSWAYNYFYQINKIVGKSGNTILLEKPLNISFSTSLNPIAIQLTTKKQVGFECFSITRLDNTAPNQTSTFFFQYATDCWVKGVSSQYTTFAHVCLESSSHITISENYFQLAHEYGGGGRAYGAVMQLGATDNFIYNNIFRNLRHSILLQAAANGNVIAYNYSREPYWNEGFFPTNSAGDIVLHGNYVFSNLIEGNIAQNIIIDNSHGANGPYNTFFRNRAELYGIIMNNSAGNSLNFVGNEVTNTTPLLGNFSLTGSNHFRYGNNIKGTIIPTGTTPLPEQTLIGSPYQSLIGIPSIINTASNSAKDRWANPTKTICNNLVNCSPTNPSGEYHVFDSIYARPNYSTLRLNLNFHGIINGTATLKFFQSGTLIDTKIITIQNKYIHPVDISNLNDGIYECYLEVASSKMNFLFKK